MRVWDSSRRISTGPSHPHTAPHRATRVGARVYWCVDSRFGARGWRMVRHTDSPHYPRRGAASWPRPICTSSRSCRASAVRSHRTRAHGARARKDSGADWKRIRRSRLYGVVCTSGTTQSGARSDPPGRALKFDGAADLHLSCALKFSTCAFDNRAEVERGARQVLERLVEGEYSGFVGVRLSDLTG